MLVGGALAVEGLGAGADVLGGDVGFLGVGREEGGDVGDGVDVAAGGVLRGVGDGGWECAPEGVDHLVVDGPGEEGWVGGGRVWFHGWEHIQNIGGESNIFS